MDKFKKREYSLKEQELLDTLDKIIEKVKIERVNKILLENNSDLEELLNNINRVIKEYSRGANDLLENSKALKAGRYIDKLEKLISLREEINSYYDNSSNSYQELLEDYKKKLLLQLKDSVFEKEFFNEKIFTSNELNRGVIKKISYKLDNPTFMKYLKKNISLKENYQTNRELYLECINILENKNKIINSIEDIASIRFICDRIKELLKEEKEYTNLDQEFNLVNEEISNIESSLVNTNLLSRKLSSKIDDLEMKKSKKDNIIQELEDLKVEYTRIYKKLDDLSISRYIIKNNPNNPTGINLCNIENEKDIKEFFISIEKLKNKLYKILNNIVNKITALNELSEREALEFANSDIKTTYNLLGLSEANINGISGEVILYMLENISDLENTNINDIKIDISDISLIDDEIDEFYMRYFDIMSNKKIKNKRL